MSTNKLSLALEKGNLGEIKNYTEDIIHEIINTQMENPDYTFTDDQLRNLSVLIKVEDFFTEDLLSKVPGLDKTYSDLLLAQGIIFLKKSDYSSSLNYLQKALIKYEKTDNKNGLANCYLFLGDNCIITGEKEKAISNYELALNFFNKKETINQFMIITNHIAVWFGFAGEISLSIEYFEKSLTNGLKYNEIGIQAAAYHGLGWNYQTKGELDLALDFFKKALAIAIEIKKIQPYYLDMWIYQQMGSIFQLRKEIKKAIEYLSMSLDISLKINNLFATAWNYYLLIALFLEENKLFEARDYLKKFENYTIKNKDNLTIEMIYELSSGLVLYNSINPLEKKLAQNKFLKVLNSEIQFKKIKINAMIYLSELLVDTMTEYTDSSKIETKTIKQLKSLSKELNEIASYQLSQHLFVETTILESKIAKQEFQFDKAFRLLNKAYKLAIQRGLTSLMGKISSEYKELFKKGDTPFLILLFILINERSLTEISDFLNISKAATSKHLKLLLNLDLIKISKEKKVRSSNIKAKYYILSSHAHTLLSPLEITLIDIFKLASKDPTSLRERFDSMKFIIRIWRKFHELTLGYLDIVENQIIPEAQGLKIKIDLEKNDFDSIIQNLNQNDSLKMYQYAINNNQYQEFLVYWNEFNNKVKSLVEKGIKDDEKQQLIFTLFLPLKALLEIESLKKRRESQ